MRVTVDLPGDMIEGIENLAISEESGNRSAVIKKALSFYLAKKARKAKRTRSAINPLETIGKD